MTNYGTLLRDHVTLRCRSIDRIFLQAYVPKLQTVGDVCIFLRWQRKFKIPSSAAFGQIGEAYVKAIHKFAEGHHIPVVHFQKGQNKEEVARPYLEAARGTPRARAGRRMLPCRRAVSRRAARSPGSRGHRRARSTAPSAGCAASGIARAEPTSFTRLAMSRVVWCGGSRSKRSGWTFMTDFRFIFYSTSFLQ